MMKGSQIPARLLTAALLVSLTVTTARAQAVNLDKANVAVSGYDAVAYQTENAARKGSAELVATYEGGTYRFVSAANRDAFLANPAKYVPAYGGYCAFGVSQGHKVKIDPEAYRVVDGRLYLNYDKGVQQKWFKDIPGFIVKADANWVELKDKPRS
jgi:YHS domain-containing protein